MMQVTNGELLDELRLRAALQRQGGPWWYGLLSDEQLVRLTTVPEEQECDFDGEEPCDQLVAQGEGGDTAGLVSVQA
jgi:hypothetical protein